MLALLIFLPWRRLLTISLSDDRYSHIAVIPLISLSLIWMDRQEIFSRMRYCTQAITLLAAIGALTIYAARNVGSSSDPSNVSFWTFCGVALVICGFLLSFGVEALRQASFPLLFLFLMMPVPGHLMSSLVQMLQDGSAFFSGVLFRLIQLPTLRHNLTFSLPGFDIDIAEQCSGIRSSIVLFIASILIGHLFLRSIWRKLLLVALTIPLVIFKNAVRIVTISSLGVYVNPGFLHGALHRYSGLPFSMVEVIVIVPLVIRWHTLESRSLRASA
jgi:exosortase